MSSRPHDHLGHTRYGLLGASEPAALCSAPLHLSRFSQTRPSISPRSHVQLKVSLGLHLVGQLQPYPQHPVPIRYSYLGKWKNIRENLGQPSWLDGGHLESWLQRSIKLSWLSVLHQLHRCARPDSGRERPWALRSQGLAFWDAQRELANHLTLPHERRPKTAWRCP